MSYKAALEEKLGAEPSFEESLIHHLNEPLGHLTVHENDHQAKEGFSLIASLPPTAWMGRCASAIGKRRLNQVVLPGAHDCGTYSLSKHSQYGPNLQKVSALRALTFIGLDKLTKGIVAAWAICQSQNTKSQLDDGIRYFDLRVATVNDRFFIWHGLCGDPIEDVLHILAEYARNHRTEILILDFIPSHFIDFSYHHHVAFSKLLLSVFGDTLASFTLLSPGSRVEEFWKRRENVIVIYNPPAGTSNALLDPELVESLEEDIKKDVYWSSTNLDSHWPNHCKNTGNWLNWAETHSTARVASISPFFVLQGVITPDVGIIAKFNGVSSVYDLSKRLNPCIVDFLVSTPHRNHNIIMADFYDNSLIVPACLWCNTGGNYIFAEKLGFGQNTHFQATIFKKPNNTTSALAIAQHASGTWHTAIFEPDLLNTWQASVPVSNVVVQDPKYYSTTRLFSIGQTAFVVVCTPLGLKIYKWSSIHSKWILDAGSESFGTSSGFGLANPTFRTTFSVVSSSTTNNNTDHNNDKKHLNHKNRKSNEIASSSVTIEKAETSSNKTKIKDRAYFVGMTCHGLEVVEFVPDTRPTSSVWSPISSDAPIEVHRFLKDYILASNNYFPTITHPFMFDGFLHILYQGPCNNVTPGKNDIGIELLLLRYDKGEFQIVQVDELPLPIKRSKPLVAVAENVRPPIPPRGSIVASSWFVQCLEDTVYIAYRATEGIRTWRYNSSGICFECPTYNAFTDEFHWDSPIYYKSLRMFTLNNELYILGRSSQGLVVSRLLKEDDLWVPVPGLTEFTDELGWHKDDSVKTLQVLCFDKKAYVTGRHKWGLISVVFDGASWSYLQRPPVLE